MTADDPDEALRPTAEAKERAAEHFKRELDSPVAVLLALGGAAGIAFLCQKVLEIATGIHWVLAALVSLAVAATYIWMVRKTRKGTHAMARLPPDQGQVSLSVTDERPVALTRFHFAATLSLGLLLAVVVCGWASYVLQEFGSLGPSVERIASLDDCMRLYFFTLADLIPVLDVAETLHVRSPVQPQTFVAGVPVLVFKAIVVLFVFETYRKWHADREKTGEAGGDLALLLACLLVFVLAVARNLPPPEPG